MSLVHITGWPLIGAIIHVGLQLGKHILMLVHCLRSCPTLTEHASCFFVLKKTLATFTSHITRLFTHQLHYWHPHRKKAVGHSLASIKPTLVQCFVLSVLRYHWTGTMLGQRKTVVGLRWQSNALSSPLIYCVLCLSPKHTRGVQPILGHRRRR